MTMQVRIASLGNFRKGISSKTGNPYIMGEGFVHIIGCPFPQKISYYCESEDQVLKSGEWLVPVTMGVRNENLDFRLNTAEAVPYKATVSTAASVKG